MNHSLRLLIVTSLALIAFAANSVFCRLALLSHKIDPVSFTSVRLLSGAAALALIIKVQAKGNTLNWSHIVFPRSSNHWIGALLLFSYAIFFSFAYTLLDTATGALILFTAVQIFLLSAQVIKGHRFSLIEILGILLAFTGFVLLNYPNASRPNLLGLGLMIVSGIAWGGYTLAGRIAKDHTINTAENFVRCIPLTFLTWFVFKLGFGSQIAISLSGLLWASLSGIFASALGYSLWYYVVKKISVTQAAISQLMVPVIAGLGGLLLVNESISMTLLQAGLLIILGIALVSLSSQKPSKK